MRLATWCALAVAGAMMAATGSALAAETQPHKGFFAGGAVGTGAETGPLNRVGGGAAARLGYGVSDRVMLYLDNNYFYTRRTGTNFNFLDSQVRVQFFPLGQWYLTTGTGLALGKAGAGTSMKAGIGTNTAAGYEFRPSEKMAVSVESGFNYRRISGTNFYSPNVLGRVDWYF